MRITGNFVLKISCLKCLYWEKVLLGHHCLGEISRDLHLCFPGKLAPAGNQQCLQINLLGQVLHVIIRSLRAYVSFIKLLTNDVVPCLDWHYRVFVCVVKLMCGQSCNSRGKAVRHEYGHHTVIFSLINMSITTCRSIALWLVTFWI